ncbi:hypothetical protein ACM43_12870 [Bradyrhizobium sp. CCBAU 45321]|nr:hypothetical protein [Bradyrhizobium sp. CCBAU 45321]
MRFHQTKMGELADFLSTGVKTRATGWPVIPISGRTTREVKKLEDQAQQTFGSTAATDGGFFFWARVPLHHLVNLFASWYGLSAHVEYVDLGTPVRALGSGSTYDQECQRLLNQSAAPNAATVGAAIVDMGDLSSGGPDSYGGMLRHTVSSGVELSQHAEQVLSVLLQRLAPVLRNTTVSCALVKPPSRPIVVGRSCFDQACTPEMQTAMQALATQLANDGLPAAVNLSLGTHVGPHNGLSPLEQYVANTLITTDRYVVAAAGNDGGTGCAAKRTMIADEPETFGLRSGVSCEELLVEFWWDDATAKDVEVVADVYEIVQGGAMSNLATLTIDQTSAGMLTTTPVGLPGSMATHSLFSAKCQNNFRCAAFALSSGMPGQKLPLLHVQFKLTAKRDVTINSWIVIAEKNPCLTAFVEGGHEGSICVPASDPSVLSVAGLLSTGKMWTGSSRGPSAEYDAAGTSAGSPHMAHLADLGGGVFGTSFASPRACGDAVATLNSSKLSKCTSALTLLNETYQLGKLPWNPRFGYHKAK